jgi:hypothetical protein
MLRGQRPDLCWGTGRWRARGQPHRAAQSWRQGDLLAAIVETARCIQRGLRRLASAYGRQANGWQAGNGSFRGYKFAWLS